jgi:hypothetical protein
MPLMPLMKRDKKESSIVLFFIDGLRFVFKFSSFALRAEINRGMQKLIGSFNGMLSIRLTH